MKAQALAHEMVPPVQGWSIYDMNTDRLWVGTKGSAACAWEWAEAYADSVIRSNAGLWFRTGKRIPWSECYRAGLRVVRVELRVTE